MQIARYEFGGASHYGIVDGGVYRRLAGSPFESLAESGARDPADAARLLCPVPEPRIFGVGLNYVSHIAESNQTPPRIPMLFMKPSLAAIGPGEPIVYPREGDIVHFEGELAVIIGRRARRVAKADALDVVFGFSCANDVSERVIQRAEMGMGCLLVGKGFDSFNPIGPVIATGLDPANLKLEARVNGELRQSINTSDLLFSVAELVSYLSQSTTLLPGDVIITGTPSGVGEIKPGDVVAITIDGVGTLTNPVVAES
jgi:2-keto-4-pentenoate hydratase/2-oxohepta-3-ene-1,7-dioic acid hydratase in catechol pathway